MLLNGHWRWIRLLRIGSDEAKSLYERLQTREIDKPMESHDERALSDWLDESADTLGERGIAYGDPRDNLLRIFKICQILGIQLRDPSDVALLFIATKLSRMVESPSREDSYHDLIGYAAILAQSRFTNWNDFDTY